MILISCFLLSAATIDFYADPIIYRSSIEVVDTITHISHAENIYYIEFNCNIPYQKLFYEETNSNIISKTRTKNVNITGDRRLAGNNTTKVNNSKTTNNKTKITNTSSGATSGSTSGARSGSSSGASSGSRSTAIQEKNKNSKNSTSIRNSKNVSKKKSTNTNIRMKKGGTVRRRR